MPSSRSSGASFSGPAPQSSAWSYCFRTRASGRRASPASFSPGSRPGLLASPRALTHWARQRRLASGRRRLRVTFAGCRRTRSSSRPRLSPGHRRCGRHHEPRFRASARAQDALRARDIGGARALGDHCRVLVYKSVVNLPGVIPHRVGWKQHTTTEIFREVSDGGRKVIHGNPPYQWVTSVHRGGVWCVYRNGRNATLIIAPGRSLASRRPRHATERLL